MLKTIIYSLIGFALGAVIFSTCNKETAKPDTTKDTINTQLKQKDSVKTVVIIKDSIVTKYRTKYKMVRYDSLIPCPEKLEVADKVIEADSSLIFSLKQELFIDSIIFLNYHKLDSLKTDSIIVLKKQVRKLKKWNKFWRNTSIGQAAINAGKAGLNYFNQ